MKHYITISILTFFLSVPIMNGQWIKEKEIAELNQGGLIKTITENDYAIVEIEKFGEKVVDKSLSRFSIIRFNEKSQIIEQTFGNPKTKYLEAYTHGQLYLLNEKGQEIGYINFDENDERTESFLDIDEDGNILQEYEIDSNGNRVNLGGPRIRDERGNQIERDMGDWGTYKSVYDSKNRQLEQNLYKDGKLDSKTKYEYYPDDKLHVSNEYFSDGSLKERHIYTYHQSGEMREDKVYDSDKTLIEFNEYNWMGDKIKTIRYSYGKPAFEERHDITYEDDVNGNWIKRTKVTKSTSPYGNGEIEITERILKYY